MTLDAAGSQHAAGDQAPQEQERPREFAHASEAEMARILDFYEVRWEYEPTTFPILWNLDGAVVESFAPDFYLPDLDLYLEMTTLRQKLVRKKNRKLRRLRELYPDIRIKLFYARDFRALMLKYGKLALVDALSGSSGQVGGGRADDTPDRAEGAVPASAPAAVEDAAKPPIGTPDAVETAAPRARVRRPRRRARTDTEAPRATPARPRRRATDQRQVDP